MSRKIGNLEKVSHAIYVIIEIYPKKEGIFIMAETWKSLKGIVECGDAYEISTTGKIRNINKNRLISTSSPKNPKSYPKVTLISKSVKKTYLFHRLVALAYLPNPLSKPFINHIDGNKHNFCLSNLEWVTAKENLLHARETGLNPRKFSEGVNNPPDKPEQYIPKKESNRAKLTEDDVRKIRQLYKTGKYSHNDLGSLFNVGKRNITQILNYKTWKHVV